jgi:hypothetical protein
MHAVTSAAAPITRQTSRDIVRNGFLGVRGPTCSHRQTTRCKELEVPPLARGSGTRFAQNASSIISLDSSPSESGDHPLQPLASKTAAPFQVRRFRPDVSGQRIGTVIMS